jgi:selenocysteine lyase/cysteine desulfurase
VNKWDSEYRLKPGAQKLEIGGSSPAPYAGLVEAINLIESIGIETVESNIQKLAQYLKRNIDEEHLVSPREFESGIVTIAPPNAEKIVAELSNKDIIVRNIPLTKNAIRISLHAFNTVNEVESLVRVIE